MAVYRGTDGRDTLRAGAGNDQLYGDLGADTLVGGRVEDRLSPALPHQTVHAIFPHTAFRCSSRQGMRRVPARLRRDFVQPVAPVEMSTWKPAEASASTLHLMTLHQMGSQPVFRMVSDFVHRQT